MKYMMMVKMDAKSEAGKNYEAEVPTDAKLEAAMGQLIEKMMKIGALVDVGGLLPMAKGAQVRAKSGKLAVMDGPFIESKEIIGGYAILHAKSKEEAVAMGRNFMQLHLDILGSSYEGELEIRQLFDPEDFTTANPTAQ